MVNQELMGAYYAMIENIEKRDFPCAHEAALKLASCAQKLMSPEDARQEYLDAKKNLCFGIFLCAFGSSGIEGAIASEIVRDALIIASALGGVDDVLSET